MSVCAFIQSCFTFKKICEFKVVKTNIFSFVNIEWWWNMLANQSNWKTKLRKDDKMLTQKLNGKFFSIPNSIFEKKLKPRDLAVYCCLVMHSNRYGYCYPSRKCIAEECYIDRKTVDTAIGVLIAAGLIEKINRKADGKKTSNVYHLIDF